MYSLFFLNYSNKQKRFVKGLRQYGKNFFRIRKDLLPHKETVIDICVVLSLCYSCVTVLLGVH